MITYESAVRIGDVTMPIFRGAVYGNLADVDEEEMMHTQQGNRRKMTMRESTKTITKDDEDFKGRKKKNRVKGKSGNRCSRF